MAGPRRTLFRKYLIAVSAGVVIPLVAGLASEAWFGYRDQSTQIRTQLQLQTEAAAQRIEAFASEIRGQLGWLVQLPWTEQDDQARLLDAVKLLRQVPAVINITLTDGSGRERAFASRRGTNRSGKGADYSQSGWFKRATTSEDNSSFGDVRYERDSEPFMTIAAAGNRKVVGTAVAYVNLKFVGEIVAELRIGSTGNVLVIDNEGRLIAHPDISLVLRGDSSVEEYSRVRTILSKVPRDEIAALRIDGRDVAAMSATIPRLGWMVVAEQPYSEAYAPVRATLTRSILLLIGGILLAVTIAYWLARRMSEPIHRLEEAAVRVGKGDLDSRVSIATGDELQTLAEQFNTMTEELRESSEKSERINRLKRFLAPQVAELIESAGHERLLGGQRRDIVVIFGDLRGFTAFSAQVEPDVIMRVLGEYFEALGAVVTANNATLANFAGDGVMILINAPVECKEPARVALRLAIEMQGAVQALAEKWRMDGFALGFGVGMAEGPATVGKIGYEGRLDYTAIGSVVNLASRLCGEAKDKEILTDQALARSLSFDATLLEDIGRRPLKGFDEPLPLFRAVRQGASAIASPP